MKNGSRLTRRRPVHPETPEQAEGLSQKFPPICVDFGVVEDGWCFGHDGIEKARVGSHPFFREALDFLRSHEVVGSNRSKNGLEKEKTMAMGVVRIKIVVNIGDGSCNGLALFGK